MPENIQPLGGRLLVQRIDEKPGGAIIVPETAKETSCRASIVARGKGVDASLQVGAQVLVPAFCGTEIKIGGSSYLFVKEEDVIAVIR